MSGAAFAEEYAEQFMPAPPQQQSTAEIRRIMLHNLKIHGRPEPGAVLVITAESMNTVAERIRAYMESRA